MRIYRIARGLAAKHSVTCLTFAPDQRADAAMAPLREICRVLTVYGPPPRAAIQRAWSTLTSSLPDMALRNASQTFAASLRDLLARERFDVVQAESIEMAQFLEPIAAQAQRPALVFDQFNAEYVLQKRAAITSLRSAVAGGKPKARLHNLAGTCYSLVQWVKLARYERRLMQLCDAVAAVSEADAQILANLAAGVRIGVIPNGVDTAEFSRAALGYPPPPSGGPTVVFSGTLDFRANVDAVTWFASEVWPKVRARSPDARLLVVGKRPTQALQELAAAGTFTLTGEVPDARPYVAGATVYIVPMRIGGGVRLKLLEALSLEAPVVSTSMGAEGVAGLRGGQHCLLADDTAGFAAATLRLIEDKRFSFRLGSAGRALVCDGYDWQSIIPRLEALQASVLSELAVGERA
jgi:glycosyltransferase involved in cell wall biosynthesis